jgi:hypothetical protein
VYAVATRRSGGSTCARLTAVRIWGARRTEADAAPAVDDARVDAGCLVANPAVEPWVTFCYPRVFDGRDVVVFEVP